VFATYASSTIVIYASQIRSGEQEKMEFFYNKNCESGHEVLKLRHKTKSKLISQSKLIKNTNLEDT
jgi:hypothetical protein